MAVLLGLLNMIGLFAFCYIVSVSEGMDGFSHSKLLLFLYLLSSTKIKKKKFKVKMCLVTVSFKSLANL